MTPRRLEQLSTDGRAARFIVRVPDLVAPALAGLSAVAMILLLLGAYRPVLVLPLGLAGALALARAAHRLDPADRAAVGPTLAAVGIAAAFGLASAIWSAQYLDSDLDPGTYANSGLWLTHHAGINIVPRTDLFGFAIAGLQSTAPGWSVFHGHIQAQGNHLLPALLAIGGWIGGPGLLLKTNAVLGSAALLALFSLSRRFIPGWWAVLPVGVAAVSLPFSAFSRATYTEPIAATLVLGGLALAVPAVRHPTRLGVAIASFVVGTACLVRIDSYVYAVGIAVVGVVAAKTRPDRRWSLFFSALLGWSVPAVLGLVDLRLLAHEYIRALRVQTTSQLVIVAAAFVLGIIVVAFSDTRVIAHALTRKRLVLLAWVGAGVIVVAFAVLASRPLWYVQRGRPLAGFGGLQALLGIPVDTTRTYGESTFTWLAWYLGWPTLVLGVLGFAVLARRIVLVPRPELAAPLVVFLVDASVYLVRPRIVPFQVWAARRFVSVAIPGLLIAATVVANALFRRARREATRRSDPRLTHAGRAIVAVLAVTMITIPAVVTWPLLRVRDHTPGLAQAETLCRTMGHDAAILLLDGVSEELGPTLAAMCGTSTATAWTKTRATPQKLARMAEVTKRNGLTLYVIATKPTTIPYRTSSAVAPTTAFAFTAWQEEILSAPHRARHWRRGYWVAKVAVDGYAEPTPAS